MGGLPQQKDMDIASEVSQVGDQRSEDIHVLSSVKRDIANYK